MGLNKCMNKALQQWCSWLRINGRCRSNRWIQGFSMCVTRTGKESESHTFPGCDWGSCAWWWAFNCPRHSSNAVLWPTHQRRQIFFPNRARSGSQSPPFWQQGGELTLSGDDVSLISHEVSARCHRRDLQGRNHSDQRQTVTCSFSCCHSVRGSLLERWRK